MNPALGVTVQEGTAQNFEVLLVSPALPHGWFLLGEPSKWVSVSAQRFTSAIT
eukprot:COSAG05_NODE_2241_length_3352_cov_2.277283_4_plen_52_part_01